MISLAVKKREEVKRPPRKRMVGANNKWIRALSMRSVRR
jgi:hypothetical protein